MVIEESREGRGLELEELLTLNRLQDQRRLSTAEVAGVVQRGESEARAILERLRERGFVEARGDGRGRHWMLSAAVYRRLDSGTAYVRQRGFERQQHEQLALQYARSHGSIRRAEAAELCQLQPRAAGRLLARLVEAGQLRRHGRKRGAWYSPV